MPRRVALALALVGLAVAANATPLASLRVERAATDQGFLASTAFSLFVSKINSNSAADAVAVVHLEPLHLFDTNDIGASYFATSTTDSGFDDFVAALVDDSDDMLIAIRSGVSVFPELILRMGGRFAGTLNAGQPESVAFDGLTPAQLASIRSIEFRVDSFTSAYASGTFIFHDAVIPEPSTALLVSAGLVGLAMRRRRR